ncbi:hypothetical protein I4U23_020018 [Adineta vaga]|nr:hypothetical protein I4U23_020018 [Adineta vaga]
MSVKQDSLFCTLPVELIFHIFRYLDVYTIVHSFRLVCRQFYTLVNTYDQFDFNFNMISKSDFHYLCNLIPPKNIKSLILSDDDGTPGQIEYFLSRFRLKQFIHLYSLTLLDIDDCHLGIILKDISKLKLVELIITSKQDFSQNNTISDGLSSAICLPTLRKFCLDIPTFDISQIIWSSKLEKLTMNELDGIIPDLTDLTPSCHLSSLTFKYCNMNMVMTQLLLSLTPTLEHLCLLRSVDVHDFIAYLAEWQKFIETKLLLLTKFEFLLTEFVLFLTTSIDIEQLIAPFRTPFWTEIKRWFVICDCDTNSRSLIMYSPSVYDPRFECSFHSKQISRSTSTSMISNTLIMNHIRKLCIDLIEAVPTMTSAQGGLPNTPVFPNIDCLTLRIPDPWPVCSLHVLSTLINLSHITKIVLKIGDLLDSHPNFFRNVDLLLKSTRNVCSLVISSARFYANLRNRDLEICSIIPKHVKHLTISISTIDQMNVVMQKLKYRSSITFVYMNTSFDPAEMHIEWFKRENGYYTYRLSNSALSMWFDRSEYSVRRLTDRDNIDEQMTVNNPFLV